jgi:hypothetical protein
MYDTAIYNVNTIRTQKFELLTPFNTSIIPAGIYRFYIRYTKNGDTNFNVILNPDNNVKGYLSITKVNQGGDGLVMKIGDNMPFGTTGIKLVDWIRGIQQKFNLVIYPSKIKQREFIVETFNDWYNKGERKDFNRYINLDEKIEVIPANNLAVNKLNFGDTLDGDYISQQFAKQQNREFGKSYYVDTNNFYSQGTFEVKTTLASSPLIRLAGTGQSGSALLKRTGFQAFASLFTTGSEGSEARAIIDVSSEQVVNATATTFGPGSATSTDPISGYAFRSVQEGTIINFSATATGDSGPTTIAFKKINDSGTTTLSTASSYTYTITTGDISQTTLNFTAEVYST